MLTLLSVAHKVKNRALLTPQELIIIHRLNDSLAITNFLSKRGYMVKTHHGEIKSGTWYFQSRKGGHIDFMLIKAVLPNGRPQLIYQMSEEDNYNEFKNNLISAGFKLSGIQIIDTKCFSVFKKDEDSFLVLNTGLNEPGFEILIR